MIIHDEDGSIAVGQIVFHPFVVGFSRKFIAAFAKLQVVAGCCLPARLWLYLSVAEHPDVCWRHDDGIGNLMDKLVQGVESCFDRCVVVEFIVGRKADVGTQIEGL